MKPGKQSINMFGEVPSSQWDERYSHDWPVQLRSMLLFQESIAPLHSTSLRTRRSSSS